MPELPEVETVKRGLAPVMEGARIQSVVLNRENLRFPFPDGFVQKLEGRDILQLHRRAKYLLMDIEGGCVVIMHLGMSGSFRVEEIASITSPGEFHQARSRDQKHDHVVFELIAKGEENISHQVIYNDPRRFGFMLMTSQADLSAHKMLCDLGVEPLGNSLRPEYLAEKFAGKQAPLKAALLDQKIIAGLGNIYVCEALWRVGLSPKRQAATLVRNNGRPGAKLEPLIEAIRDILSQAIKSGGSSLNDHAQVDGSLGYFQHRFNAYDREGEPCPKAKCQGEIQRITQSGRSTFYCPTCQK